MGAIASALNFLSGGTFPRAMALGPRELGAPTVIEAKTDKRSTSSKQIGGAGTSIWNGHLSSGEANADTTPDRWLGDGHRIGIADQMMRDPRIRSSGAYVKDPVAAAVWDFEPASKSELDVEIADFAYWMLIERLPWDAYVDQVLRYIEHGVSLFEVTDDARPVPTARFKHHAGRGVGILPTGLHQRLPSTIWRWNQSADDPTKLESVVQYIYGSDKERAGERVIPADRLLRWTWEQDAANFTGFAPLRSCYGAWKTKLLLQVIDAIRHERQGLGTPTITLPEGATDDDKVLAAEILANMRANEQGFMVLSNGFKFEWSTTGAAVSTNILDGIRFCNDEIAANFKVGFMNLGSGGGQVGPYNLAGTQEGNYQISLDKHARFICRGINRGSDGWSFVERYVRLNYGPDVDLPTLVARNMPTRNWTTVSSTLVSLASQGFITPDEPTEAYLREALLVPQHDPASARDAAGTKKTEAPKTATPATTQPQDAPALDTTKVDEAVDAGKAAAAANGAALNGAQVTSFRQILLDAATRQMPRESGVKFIATAFPIGEARAEEVMGEIGRTFFVDAISPTPATKTADAATQDASAPGDGGSQ